MKLATALNQAAAPLGVFRYRNFSLVWTSSTLVATGTQMEAVVLGWYILTLTESSFLVGLIWTARMSLNLLALFAGAIADRVPRHRLLAVVEFVMAGLGAVMLALILSGQLAVWHIFGITMLVGLVRVFQMPSAQSLVADTLPSERIGNGAAFSGVAMNLGMLVGPLMGGLLFKSRGVEGAYVAIVSLYLLGGGSTLLIRGIQRSSTVQRESVFRTVITGLRFVKSEQVLWATLLLAVIIEFNGWTFHTTLMPVFARQVLETDAAGLGWLMFAFGLGALSGSLGWAMARNLRRVGLMMILSVVFWHVSILLLAATQSFYFTMTMLVLVGAGWASTQVFLLTALLRTAGTEYRGRVIGLRSLAIYAFALGSMSSGAMAQLWGAAGAATVVAVTGIVLVTVLAVFAPKLRRF